MATEELKWFLFTPKCFEYFQSFDFSSFINDGCHAFAISKVLGYSIIAGSMGLKVPQLLKILSSQSAKGLSILSLTIETLGFGNTTAYFYRQNYPLSTYGEAPIIFTQNIILLLLIFMYQNAMNIKNICLLLFVFGFIIFAISDNMPFFIVEAIFGAQFLITFGSRAPQIYSNFQQKSTGALAFTTVFLQFGGCCARLFTTIQEIDDIIPLLLYIWSTLLNGILLVQFFIYSSDTGSESSDESTKKSNKQSNTKQRKKESKKKQ